MEIQLETVNDGKIYSEWGDVDVTLNLDTVASTFRFTTYMTDDNRHLFKPFSYIECIIWKIDDDGNRYRLITGFIVNASPSIQKVPRMNTIQGFSKCGIIEKITMPVELYPLQYNGSSLTSICESICKFFGLTLYVHDGAAKEAGRLYTENVPVVGVGTVLKDDSIDTEKGEDFSKEFRRLQCKPDEYIKKFLSRIAKERGITVAHNERGDLLLYRILNTIKATSELRESDLHFDMKLKPNMQGVHSQITVIVEAETDDEETTEITDTNVTVYSPWFKGIEIITKLNENGENTTKTVPLPKTIRAKNIQPSEIKKYAQSELCKEAKNFPVIMTKYGWLFPDTLKGGLRSVRAGFFLIVDAPSIFIREQQMVIQSMRFSKKVKEPEMLELTTILPSVYTGKLPEESPFIN